MKSTTKMDKELQAVPVLPRALLMISRVYELLKQHCTEYQLTYEMATQAGNVLAV